MKKARYNWVIVSTQADEDAQHFYRKIGYQDTGGLVLNIPCTAQPMELFLPRYFKKCHKWHLKECFAFFPDQRNCCVSFEL